MVFGTFSRFLCGCASLFYVVFGVVSVVCLEVRFMNVYVFWLTDKRYIEYESVSVNLSAQILADPKSLTKGWGENADNENADNEIKLSRAVRTSRNKLTVVVKDVASFPSSKDGQRTARAHAKLLLTLRQVVALIHPRRV